MTKQSNCVESLPTEIDIRQSYRRRTKQNVGEAWYSASDKEIITDTMAAMLGALFRAYADKVIALVDLHTSCSCDLPAFRLRNGHEQAENKNVL